MDMMYASEGKENKRVKAKTKDLYLLKIAKKKTMVHNTHTHTQTKKRE